MPRVQVERFDDPAAYLGATEPLLLADEARHNLMLGIAGNLRDHPGLYLEFRGWLARENGSPVGTALQTPPYNLVLARAFAPGGIEALAEALREQRAELPGVTAAVPEADEFAEAWLRRARLERRVRMRQRIYRLTAVRPGSGRTRAASLGDLGRPAAPPGVGPRVREARASTTSTRRPPSARWPPGSIGAPEGSRSGRTSSRYRSSAGEARRRTGSASGLSTRRRSSGGAATRARSPHPSPRSCSPPAGASASSTRTSRTRPRTASTPRSATSPSATRWTTLSCPAGQETLA